ncbi:MAG TPA: UDP-N-acetylmuramoyl-tripeptide--D-alanyl-D-alanine ligase [Candidatus Woesebacteria bacterium]|nr:UDP-N-acetylmuramoyl-tripeptide--D-alanyl-D-alanine ligase [Candidatus Woesebacteria bacterium]
MSTYQPTGIKKIFHNTRRFLAKNWLLLMPVTQIAITGSQGKTNTTNLITHICQHFGSTVVTDTNLDTTFNVPITALKVMPWTKYVIWELGIDHPGEMDRHLQIAKPTIGIITGISPVHTDKAHMGSLETLISEKRKLIEALPKTGTAILNFDDMNVRSMATYTKAKVEWYDSDSTSDLYVDPESIQLSLEGTQATFHFHGQTFEIKTKLVGVQHIQNLMAAYLVMTIIQPSATSIEFNKIIAPIEPLKGRMSVDKGPLNTILLNDSLRANPASTFAGLDSLNRINYTNGRKIAVIGEMGELEKPEEEHKKTGAQIAKLNLDYVLVIGPLRKFTIDEAIKNGFPKEKIDYAADVFEAAEKLKSILKPNDLWYLKGSLLRNYKRIIQLLNGEEVCCNAVLCPYDHCGYDTN